MSLMRTFIRRTFALAAVITLAAALFVMPAQAKKKADPKTDPTTTTQTYAAPRRFFRRQRGYVYAPAPRVVVPTTGYNYYPAR